MLKKHKKNKNFRKFPFAFLIPITLVILAILIGLINKVSPQTQSPSSQRIVKEVRKSDPNISKDASDLMTSDDALYSYVKKYGLKQTAVRLLSLPGDCHDTAHKAGRFGYEIYGTQAFKLSSSECHSGEYHGATEEFFKEHGTANLQDNLRTLCNSELNPFFSHQCVHGIGHGLMAWTSYDLLEALKDCDLLTQRQDSCYTGVFMENIVGGLAEEEGHFTKYLNEDPQYPCTEVSDKYKSSCYFLQTSRMMQLFSGDFQKVAKACSEVPVNYQNSCFQSMGRDVGGSNRGNPQGAITACSNAPFGELRNGCLSGAVQDSFWDEAGQDEAIEFCTLLQTKNEKDPCYKTIIYRAPDVIVDKAELSNFCSKLEVFYQKPCNQYVKTGNMILP